MGYRPAMGDPRFDMPARELARLIELGEIDLSFTSHPDATLGVYARLSRKDTESESIERQLVIAIREAQRMEAPYAVWIDRGKSAARVGGKRPEFDRMLGQVYARRTTVLIAWRSDRFYRQLTELGDTLVKPSQEGRISVRLIGVSDKDEFDLTNHDGRLKAQGRVLEAEKESARISQRVGDERQQRREDGLCHYGRRPFGWRSWDTEVGQDPVEAKVLRDAYDFVDGGGTVNGLYKQWTAAGIVTPLGKPWNHQNITRVLRNPRNAGRLSHTVIRVVDGKKHRTRELVRDGAWPHLVDPGQFDRVIAILDERANPWLGWAGRRRMLSGLLYCGKLLENGHPCGAKLLGFPEIINGVRKQRYACGRAPHLQIDGAFLEGYVMEQLRRRLDDPRFVAQVEAARRRTSGGAALVTELEGVTRRIKTTMAAYEDGKYDGLEQEYYELLAKLKRRRSQIDAQLDSLPTFNPAMSWAGKAGELGAEVWKRLDVGQKRAIVEGALGKITIAPGRARTKEGMEARVSFGARSAVPCGTHEDGGQEDGHSS